MLTWSEVVISSAVIHPEWGATEHHWYLIVEAQDEEPMVDRWLNVVLPSHTAQEREVNWLLCQEDVIRRIVALRHKYTGSKR